MYTLAVTSGVPWRNILWTCFADPAPRARVLPFCEELENSEQGVLISPGRV
jgi:hypothetical protein